eukprot:3306713-Rhodomonas_salina.2
MCIRDRCGGAATLTWRARGSSITWPATPSTGTVDPLPSMGPRRRGGCDEGRQQMRGERVKRDERD